MLKHRQNIDGFILVMVLLCSLAAQVTASPQPNESKQLKWRTGKITVTVSSSLFNQRLSSDESVTQAIRDGLAAWEAASDISLASRDSNLQSVSPKGAKGDGVSLLTIASTPENLKLFPLQSGSPAATTRVFYNARGEITEADIVLNPYVQFSTNGAVGTYELRAVLTHEIGHLLGLEHSAVWGSRMFERTGKIVDSAAVARMPLLTMSDQAAVRALYGAKMDDVTCCSSVAARADLPRGVKAKSAIAWLEESATGRVVASTYADPDGSFRFGGIAEGRYRAFAQYEFKDGGVVSGSTEVQVELGDEASVSLDITASNISPSPPSFIGLNAQLARLPIALNAGQTFRIWTGGAGLAADDSKPRFSSDILSASFESIRTSDYSSNVKAFSFEIRIALEVQPGEYSIGFEDRNNLRRYIVGAISVYPN